MDLKTIVILVVALVIVFFLIFEINAFKTDMNRKFADIDIIMEKQHDDMKTTLKKEILNVTVKFKTYTSELIQQIRTMNNIEKQTVTMMSDHFIEIESNDDKHQIPYLSEMNQVVDENKRKDANDSELYMSETSDANGDRCDFKVKDMDNNILTSTKISDGSPKNTASPKQKLSDKNNKIQVCSPVCTGNENDAMGKENNIENRSSDDEVIDICDNKEDMVNSANGETEENEADKNKETKRKKKSINNDDEEVSQSKMEIMSKTLHKLKKIQASMIHDDESSQEITIGTTNKGTSLAITSGKKNKGIVENLSICTRGDDSNSVISSNYVSNKLSKGVPNDNDSINSQKEKNTFKLKSISRYSKNDLDCIAKSKGIKIPDGSSKVVIYEAIKKANAPNISHQ